MVVPVGSVGCVVGIAGCCEGGANANGSGWAVPSCRKCPSSRVDIGWVGYANGSSDGNMIGMRSGTFPIFSSDCDICSADRSWFGNDVGKGDTEDPSVVNVSEGVETVSGEIPGVGVAHVPNFLE